MHKDDEMKWYLTWIGVSHVGGFVALLLGWELLATVLIMSWYVPMLLLVLASTVWAFARFLRGLGGGGGDIPDYERFGRFPDGEANDRD